MKRFYTFFVILIGFSCWLSVADAQTVRMPDANLAAVVRDALGLAPDAPITKQVLQKLTSLDAQSHKIREITGQGGVNDLTGLEHATQLTRLWLNNNQISDISPLARLTRLEKLGIWNNQISDIRPLAGLTQLRSLAISDNPINDLRPLASLTQLRRLVVSVRLIGDLRRQVDLTQLESLGIWGQGNQIRDLHLLGSLTQLTGLDVRNAQIRDLRFLERLTQLESLDLYGNEISDLKPLTGLTQLRELYLWSNQVRDVSPLAGLTNLEALSLSDNQVRDVSPLAGLTNLEYLSLGGNPIQDASPLASLTKLRDVDIEIPRIPTVYIRDELERPEPTIVGEILRYRMIIRNAEDVTGFRLTYFYPEDIVSIKSVNWFDNITHEKRILRSSTLPPGQSIRDVAIFELNAVSAGTGALRVRGTFTTTQGIFNVDIQFPITILRQDPVETGLIPDPNLAAAVREKLELAPNAPIAKEAMQKLTNLDARDREIKNLTGLEHATQLRELFLYDNQIRNLTPLAGLTQLKTLGLDGNQINNVRPLTGLTQLELLHIGRNQIKNNGVQLLTSLKQLKWLSLYSNQISNIKPLANLTKLEGLWLNENKIRDISPLAGLVNLETLHLKGNPIQDASLLASLTKLTDVDIDIPKQSPLVHVESPDHPPMYWVNTDSGTLHRLIGTEVENLLPNVQNATHLAIDVANETLYWTEQTGKTTGKIRRANLNGTNVQLVKNLTSIPQGIALDTTSGKIYLTNAWGKVQHLNIDDSNFQPNFITGLDAPKGLALDMSSGKIYWTETAGRIQCANLDGSNVEDVATGLGTPINIAIFDNTVYWTVKTAENQGEIRFVNLQGNPNVVPHNSFTQDFPVGIAVDPVDQMLYWTTSLGTIGRSALDGSNFQPNLVTGLSAPGTLALRVETPVDVETPVVAATDAVLSISPSSVVSPAIGEQLTFNLNIAAGEAVAGYQVTLQFDPTALRYVESSNGDYLPTGAFFVPPVVNRDRVELAATALTGVSNGDGTLATVTFEVVAVKTSTLTLSETLLADNQGNTFLPQVEAGEITEPPELKADVNADGVVNIQDLVLVASSFGQIGQNSADVNADGVVNIADLVLVAGGLSAAAGAPSLHAESLELLTAVDVHEWLSQAHQLNNINVNYQRGVLVLEQLLAALTPKETTLLSNYPNPFNPETWIPYQLANASDVKITIYDTRGIVVRQLALGHQPPGFYTDRSRAGYWDGRNVVGERVASGIYFYQLQTDNVSLLRKMLILK